MALTDSQKTILQVIVELSDRTVLDYLLANVTAGQEEMLAADIDTYDSIKDKHTQIKGGADGVDFSNERTRAAIRKRCLTHLWMDADSSGRLRRA